VQLRVGAAAIDNAIKVPKAGEVVAERIRRQIATGQLAVGHQLPQEEDLTAMFGIARTTLREALRVLESQGLIKIKRGRGGGAIVTEPKLDSVAEMMAVIMQMRRTTLGDLDDARMMIEPPLAGRLARAHTDEDLEVLTAIVDIADAAAEAEDNQRFGLAAAALHEAIITRGGNNTMAIFGTLLHDILEHHFGSAAASTDRDMLRRAVRSYRKLLALIEEGDETGATAHWHRQLVFLYKHRAGIQLLDFYGD
jgi:GntR family transcriptional regulator, transcriptional repressor for pyruvate dehydrogenase complex